MQGGTDSVALVEGGTLSLAHLCVGAGVGPIFGPILRVEDLGLLNIGWGTIGLGTNFLSSGKLMVDSGAVVTCSGTLQIYHTGFDKEPQLLVDGLLLADDLEIGRDAGTGLVNGKAVVNGDIRAEHLALGDSWGPAVLRFYSELQINPTGNVSIRFRVPGLGFVKGYMDKYTYSDIIGGVPAAIIATHGVATDLMPGDYFAGHDINGKLILDSNAENPYGEFTIDGINLCGDPTSTGGDLDASAGFTLDSALGSHGSSQSSLLHITGNATLGGYIYGQFVAKSVNDDSLSYVAGDHFTILTADSGISGTFSDYTFGDSLTNVDGNLPKLAPASTGNSTTTPPPSTSLSPPSPPSTGTWNMASPPG